MPVAADTSTGGDGWGADWFVGWGANGLISHQPHLVTLLQLGGHELSDLVERVLQLFDAADLSPRQVVHHLAAERLAAFAEHDVEAIIGVALGERQRAF